MKKLTRMTNAGLFASIERLARRERRNLPRILARLAELDKRQAPPPTGSSLFDYCLRTLRWSEAETARRIQVARAASRFEEIYSHLFYGKLTLTTAALLAPNLTPENRTSLVSAALGRSKREVEALVAGIAPRTQRPERMRVLGPQREAAPRESTPLFAGTLASAGTPSSAEALAPARPGAPTPPTTEQVTRPLAGVPAASVPAASVPAAGVPAASVPAASVPAAPHRIEVRFTVDEDLAREIEDARTLLRNKYPFCRLEDVFRESIALLLRKLDPERQPDRRCRAKRRVNPSAPSRRIPPAVRAYVWKRDQGRCTHAGPDGTRCQARAFLEFDHIRPWSLGGPSDDPRNLRLLCRAHNMQSARRVFGFI